MLRTISTSLLVSFAVAAFAEDRSNIPFVQLFNGKDLSGWKAHPESKAKWEVFDGCITATGPASHLFSERGDYSDVVFRIEAKINEGGNSGQYFRAQFGESWPKGYEAQINATHDDKVKTGSLYPAFNPKLTLEQKKKILVSEANHKVDEWFTQEVMVQGNHITIKVNGKTTVDFIDENNSYMTGHFAIQHHDPKCRIMIRKAEVAELKHKK